jgi:hypothetical protein
VRVKTSKVLAGICALAACALLGVARAEHTRVWRQDTFSEFDKGTAKGVALGSDGWIGPAPKLQVFADPNLSYLWSLLPDGKGNLYAAGGSNAKVLRFDAAGKSTKVFESQEMTAQALALDAAGNLYVGTAPDGKIYRVTPDGKQNVFFEPKTKYIWALAFDRSENLFVGTGDKGEVYVVGKDGKSAVYFKSDEHHARALAFDSNGNLLIGTDPDGLILRVGPLATSAGTLPTAGKAFVVYDTAKKEVVALLSGPDGVLYAAALGQKSEGTSERQQPISTAAINFSVNAAAAQAAAAAGAAQQAQPSAPPAILIGGSGGGEVYEIHTDGSPETLWTSREELPYALGLSAQSKLLVGTGNEGRVIELDGNETYTVVAKTSAGQVTSLANGPNGKVYAATANPGQVMALGPEYTANGEYISQAFDSKLFSAWGKLTWWGPGADGKETVQFFVRSGNTSNPDKYWSEWEGPYSNPQGDTPAVHSARFAQWKAVFPQAQAGHAARVHWVNLSYLPKNVAPVIDGIALQEPGVRAQGFGNQIQSGANSTPVQLHMPESGASANTGQYGAESQQRQKQDIPPQGFKAKGYQSVLWTAHDENDDDLIFSVYYRGEGEKDWRLLAHKLTEHFYSWDTTSMPDGAYYLKIVASDSPSNPPEEMLQTERISGRFVVNNTPPAIEGLQANTADGSVTVSFTARDGVSVIRRAEYTVDAEPWKIVLPDGRLSDSRVEKYMFELKGITAGEHSVAVRVYDEFDNVSVTKTNFTVSAGASR